MNIMYDFQNKLSLKSMHTLFKSSTHILMFTISTVLNLIFQHRTPIIASRTKSCFTLQQVTGWNCVTLIAAIFVTSVLKSKYMKRFFSAMAESWKNLKGATAFSLFLVCLESK